MRAVLVLAVEAAEQLVVVVVGDRVGVGDRVRVRGRSCSRATLRNLAHLIQLCVIGLRSRIDVCGVTRKRQRSIVRNLITTTVGRLEQARVHRPPAQPTMSQKVNPDTGLHTASSAR